MPPGGLALGLPDSPETADSPGVAEGGRVHWVPCPRRAALPFAAGLCGAWPWPVPASSGSCQELSPRRLLAQDLVSEEETSGNGVETRLQQMLG